MLPWQVDAILDYDLALELGRIRSERDNIDTSNIKDLSLKSKMLQFKSKLDTEVLRIKKYFNG